MEKETIKIDLTREEIDSLKRLIFTLLNKQELNKQSALIFEGINNKIWRK